ncbi:MAG: hypothetical protein K2X77_18555 [Candidatus Obscuribacterales bacterium]|jgi:hypothetical protein|nr:hypothetical protein [Candidatus Obscuribacterales bacterium]
MTLQAEDLIDEQATASDGATETGAQVAPFDPQEFSRQILSQVQSTVRNALPRQEQSQQRSAMESVIAGMLAKGYEPQAVQQLVQLHAASEQDKAAKKQAEDLNRFVAEYEGKCWEMADDALSAYEGVLPALKDDDIRAAILNKTSKIFTEDKEFAPQRERGGQGLLPTKDSIKRAVAKAVKDYSEKNGIAHKPMPSLDLRSSKPDPVSTKSDDPFEGLSEAERKYALSIRSHLKLSNSEAAKRARGFNKS